MKKKNFLALIVCCSLCLTTNVYASCTDYYSQDEINYIVENSEEEILDLQCSNGTLFTDEYLNIVNADKEAILSEQRLMPRYFVYKLDITNYEQQYWYYCGPANVKQVLQYLNGTSESQSTYASYMGTSSGVGTYVYKIVNALNHYSSKTYKYVLGNSYTKWEFSSLVASAVSNEKPIILHARTSSLNTYNGTDLGHYITVNGHTLTGSFGDTGIYNIYYVDTYNNDYGNGSTLGEHMDTTEHVYNTVSVSGRYIIY